MAGEGSPGGNPKESRAESASDLRLYNTLKRVIPWRSLLFVCVIGAFLAARQPKLGFDLVLGGIFGILNMRLVMRANERLLSGRGAAGALVASSFVRISGVAAAAAAAAILGPWWAMGVFFAGFFLPIALYALELNRRYKSATAQPPSP